EVTFVNGILELKQLQGRFPAPPGTPGGAFTGSARMGLGTFDVLTANLELDRVPLAALAETQARKLDLGGTVSGKVSAQVPVAGTFTASVDVKGQLEPLKYQAGGQIVGANLKIDKFAVTGAKFRWQTAGDQLVVDDLVAKMYGGQATGKATLPLKADTGGS